MWPFFPTVVFVCTFRYTKRTGCTDSHSLRLPWSLIDDIGNLGTAVPKHQLAATICCVRVPDPVHFLFTTDESSLVSQTHVVQYRTRPSFRRRALIPSLWRVMVIFQTSIDVPKRRYKYGSLLIIIQLILLPQRYTIMHLPVSISTAHCLPHLDSVHPSSISSSLLPYHQSLVINVVNFHVLRKYP